MKEETDKGWAWAVAFSALLINFIVAGLGRVSGILFVAFIDTYGVDRRGASMPFSVRSSMRNLLGPVVGIMGQKYGVRKVIGIGGVLGTVSAGILFFSTDILWITVLWGGINGASAALISILPQVTIGQYFKKYRTTAAGMGFSGGCVGSFLFPVLIEQMILAYGIEGTFLVISAIVAHTIPCAIILMKPPWLKVKKSHKKSKTDVGRARGTTTLSVDNLNTMVKDGSDSNINGESFTAIGNLASKDSLNRESDVFPNVQFLRRNNDLVVKMLTMKNTPSPVPGLSVEAKENESTHVIEACVSDALEDMYCCLQQYSRNSKAYMNFGFSKNNLLHERFQKEDAKFLSNKTHRSFHLGKRFEVTHGGITKTNSEPDVSTISNEISSNYLLLKLKVLLRANPTQVSALLDNEIKDDVLKILVELRKLYNMNSRLNNLEKIENVPEQCEESPVVDSEVKTDANSNSFFTHAKTAVRLYGNPLFLLICMCRTCHFITFVPVVTTVVDFVIDKGMKAEEGKYVIAALSLGDLIGRLCFGWVTDRGYLTLPKYMLIGMIIQGSNTIALPLMKSNLALYLTLCTFGLFQGSLFVRHAVLVSKYMGKNEQSIAMGCLNFFSGFMGFLLPFYIGYFRDTVGSYDYIFYINGTIGISIGLMWAFEPYLLRCHSSLQPMDNERADSA